MAFIVLENIGAGFLDCRFDFCVVLVELCSLGVEDDGHVLSNVGDPILPDAETNARETRDCNEEFPSMVLIKPLYAFAEARFRRVIQVCVRLQGFHIDTSQYLPR